MGVSFFIVYDPKLSCQDEEKMKKHFFEKYFKIFF